MTMKDTYIHKIGEEIRLAAGSSAPNDKQFDELFNIYAVLALSKGKKVTDEDVHDA